MLNYHKILSIALSTIAVFAAAIDSAAAQTHTEMRTDVFSQTPNSFDQSVYFARLLGGNEFLNRNLFGDAVIQDRNAKIVYVNSRFAVRLPIEKIADPRLWTLENMARLVPTARFQKQGQNVRATYAVSGLAKLVVSSISCDFSQVVTTQNQGHPDARITVPYFQEQGLPQGSAPNFVVVQRCRSYDQVFVDSLQVIRFYCLPTGHTLMTARTLMSVRPDFYSRFDLPFVSPWKQVRDNYLSEVFSLKTAIERQMAN